MSEEERTVLMGPEAEQGTPSALPEPPAPEAPALWAGSAEGLPAEAVVPQEATTAPEMPALPPKLYQGNGWDITALLATATGVLAILSCGSFGFMVYCLPVLPLILGIVAVVAARRAAEPRRSRVLGWIGLGSGALTTVLLIALALVWVVAMVVSFVLPLVMIAISTAGAAGGMPDWGGWGN